MSKLTDVSAIIISIIGTGAVLAMLILTGQSDIKDDMNRMRSDIVDLQQRTARIEGQLTLLIEAWDINKPAAPVTADN